MRVEYELDCRRCLPNVIYSGLCEGEKENGAGEKKMLAVVDFFFAFFINSNFLSAAGNFFSLVSASKTLNFFHTEETKEFLYPEARAHKHVTHLPYNSKNQKSVALYLH